MFSFAVSGPGDDTVDQFTGKTPFKFSLTKTPKRLHCNWCRSAA